MISSTSSYPPDLLGELYGVDRWNGLPAGESRLQIGVRNAFEALYEDQWEPRLRNTVCVNVCPLRTKGAEGIADKLWDESVKWFSDVIEDLKPTTNICIGASRPSPWDALKVVRDYCERVVRDHS